MGVTGLWRLIEPSGKPVPVETLENKVLAVDISIWLHQVVKGYQDAKGAPLPNAHLMGLFQRLCKLLYFKIKPVFVFDGAFPDLKKETIAKRQDSKSRYHSESERLKRELALLLSKKTAVTSLLGNQISPTKRPRPDGPVGTDDDIFKLPALPQKEVESESESSEEDTSSGSIVDLHSVDLESDNFKQLPVKEKYDVLVELKETRKMNSWGRLHELPKKSDNFSDFQLQRLLKRRKVQECLEETEKEMGSNGMSLNDLEALLNEEGIDTKMESLPTSRIASNENTRFLFIKNVKKALADAKEQKNKKLIEENAKAGSSNEDVTEIPSSSKDTEVQEEPGESKNDELEDDLQKAIAMSLECADDPNTSVANTTKTDDSWTSFLTDSDYSNSASDSEEADGFEHTDMSTAKAYIMQYSDYTHRAIEKIIDTNKTKDKQRKALPKVDEILQELDKEKTIIADNVDLSSDEDGPKDNVKPEIKIEVDSDSDNFDVEPMPEENKSITENNLSVISIKDGKDEVISLDTSNDESIRIPIIEIIKPSNELGTKLNSKVDQGETISAPEVKLESDTSDSDSEFEEVADDKTSTPVVEFSLKLGEAPEDDIFADVFVETQRIQPAKEIKSVGVVKDKQNISKKHVEFDNVINDELNLEDQCEVMGTESTLNNNTEDLDTIPSRIENQPTNIAPRPKVKNNSEVPSTSTTIDKTLETVQNQTNSKPNQLPFEARITETPTEPSVEKLKEPMSREQLNSLVEEMQVEEQNLVQEKSRLDRIGRNITEQMTKEAQELLQIFGIPYIVAPMEAEAQCAFLESVNLTDGTITDDSDIWLFGGRTVYKNFFNQKKHVLQFVAERIERSYNLSREHLILLALLVGSDYTTGVNGVGPVTAMEILASFPYSKKQLSDPKTPKHAHLVAGLQEFKKWMRSGRRTDNTTLKKKLKNVDITDEFPSVRVVQAYLEPNIEKSEDKFTWGELDITILRDYTKAKFGWSQNKLDEIMKPVLKVMQDRQTQRSIQDYFKRKIDYQSLDDQMSKRVKAAVQKMGPEGLLGEPSESEKTKPKARKRNNKAGSQITNNTESNNQGEGEGGTVAKVPKTKTKQKKVVNEELTSSKIVKVKSVHEEENKAVCAVDVVKSERYQELIPQREKEKQSHLQNKMKAIEVFRKTKLDPKSHARKRRANLPKDRAELSESDSD